MKPDDALIDSATMPMQLRCRKTANEVVFRPRELEGLILDRSTSAYPVESSSEYGHSPVASEELASGLPCVLSSRSARGDHRSFSAMSEHLLQPHRKHAFDRAGC